MFVFPRRNVLFGLAASSLFGMVSARAAASSMVVHKDPNCGCCSGWIKHMQAAGFEVRVNEVRDLAPLKSRLGIPTALSSCHTAEIEGYVIEGHVPAAAIRRLLVDRPRAIGLAVAGMPLGSPGMEVQGRADEPYDVHLFGASSHKLFARYKGLQELQSGL